MDTMPSVRNWMKNAGFSVKYYAGSHPLFYRLLFLRGREHVQRVDDSKLICIEGFPRSGNTYAVGCFLVSNRSIKAEGNIAHHTHVAMQIVNAARAGVPCIAVIREPVATLASWLLARPFLDPRLVLRHYCWFYECVEPVSDEVIIADFNTVIGGFDLVMSALNRKYSTSFAANEIDEVLQAEIFDGIRKRHRALQQPQTMLPMPDPERTLAKRALELKLQDLCEIERARNIYTRLLERAV